ncbi:hypothetical protein [Rhizobium grahamii]|uniref:Uncharacterized protein n=1 Tax=Rhizobium grahamii CCGE 502 TaxID=990285 RepID=S3HHZ1_9HYPH|nr:hypothetical protein [Rhizobium grahamii]EPE98442.1 hypothetical protein RGCCGE502_08445 [Rhizobium grahamii CCGE 502]
MKGIVDLDKLGPADRAALLDAMAEDQPPELAALLWQAAKALRKIGGIQMPLIPNDPLPFGFDREERLPDGRSRWLRPKEAAPIMKCSLAAVYARFEKNPTLGVRDDGTTIWIDRVAIMRLKEPNSRNSRN